MFTEENQYTIYVPGSVRIDNTEQTEFNGRLCWLTQISMYSIMISTVRKCIGVNRALWYMNVHWVLTIAVVEFLHGIECTNCYGVERGRN